MKFFALLFCIFIIQINADTATDLANLQKSIASLLASVKKIEETSDKLDNTDSLQIQGQLARSMVAGFDQLKADYKKITENALYSKIQSSEDFVAIAKFMNQLDALQEKLNKIIKVVDAMSVLKPIFEEQQRISSFDSFYEQLKIIIDNMDSNHSELAEFIAIESALRSISDSEQSQFVTLFNAGQDTQKQVLELQKAAKEAYSIDEKKSIQTKIKSQLESFLKKRDQFEEGSNLYKIFNILYDEEQDHFEKIEKELEAFENMTDEEIKENIEKIREEKESSIKNKEKNFENLGQSGKKEYFEEVKDLRKVLQQRINELNQAKNKEGWTDEMQEELTELKAKYKEYIEEGQQFIKDELSKIKEKDSGKSDAFKESLDLIDSSISSDDSSEGYDEKSEKKKLIKQAVKSLKEAGQDDETVENIYKVVDVIGKDEIDLELAEDMIECISDEKAEIKSKDDRKKNDELVVHFRQKIKEQLKEKKENNETISIDDIKEQKQKQKKAKKNVLKSMLEEQIGDNEQINEEYIDDKENVKIVRSAINGEKFKEKFDEVISAMNSKSSKFEGKLNIPEKVREKIQEKIDSVIAKFQNKKIIINQEISDDSLSLEIDEPTDVIGPVFQFDVSVLNDNNEVEEIPLADLEGDNGDEGVEIDIDIVDSDGNQARKFERSQYSCKYFDEKLQKWVQDEDDVVLEELNQSYGRCKTTHFTEFIISQKDFENFAFKLLGFSLLSLLFVFL